MFKIPRIWRKLLSLPERARAEAARSDNFPPFMPVDLLPIFTGRPAFAARSGGAGKRNRTAYGQARRAKRKIREASQRKNR